MPQSRKQILPHFGAKLCSRFSSCQRAKSSFDERIFDRTISSSCLCPASSLSNHHRTINTLHRHLVQNVFALRRRVDR